MSPTAEKIATAIRKVRTFYQRSRKAVLAALPVLGMIIGVDTPLYADIIGILTVAGIYVIPNKQTP